MSFLQDTAGITYKPVATIKRLKDHGNLPVALLLITVFYAGSSISTFIFPPTQTLKPQALFLYRTIIVWGPLAIILFVWFIPSLLIHSAARITRTKGSLLSLMRVLAYPLVIVALIVFMLGVSLDTLRFLGLIYNNTLPGFLGLVGSVWLISISFLAVREVYEVSTGRAILILFLGLVCFFVLGVLLLYLGIIFGKIGFWYLQRLLPGRL